MKKINIAGRVRIPDHKIKIMYHDIMKNKYNEFPGNIK
jgi:hypothetical protein